MTTRARTDLDTLLNDLTRAAFAVLAAWSLVGLYGTLGGYLEVNRPATFRFLLAILVMVFAHRFQIRVHERRLRRLPPDERYGFGETVSDPLALATEAQQTEG